MLNCVQTGNIELKKLVYLYLINYAKTQPELTLLAVNTFVKDANDPNPLIRALAVRTMGCIRVDRITEYLCEPLGKALRDEDPVSGARGRGGRLRGGRRLRLHSWSSLTNLYYRPVRPQDRRRVRGKAVRHRPRARRGARLHRDPPRPHQRLQPQRGGQW